MADALSHFPNKGGNEQTPRLRLGQAARHGIEERVFVESANGIAVRTGDIIGVDFQFGL